MTRKGFHDFAKDLDKLVVELFQMAPRQENISRPREDYKKHSLSSENISLEDTIGIQRLRVVLSLEDED